LLAIFEPVAGWLWELVQEVSLALIAARRITLKSMISFGPFMLAGALLATLAEAR